MNPGRTRLEPAARSLQIRVVFRAFVRRVHGLARRTAERVEEAMQTAARPASVVGGLLWDAVRSREELMAENTLLRQQLIVAARTVKKPRFTTYERGLLVILARLVPRWRDALLVVKPDTILRWHREGFRLFWRARSRPPEASVPRVSPATVDLIRRLANDNRLWGAERIRGELLKLGIRVAKRTIQKHMRRLHGPHPWGQSWSPFLKSHLHQSWACDFLQLYDIWFQPIFAFFIIELGSRKVVHVAATRHPSTTWVAQQLRNATPFGDGPRFFIRDNDDKFGPAFDRAAKGAGVRVLRTAPKAPLMNSFCERFLGSVRRECLDHVVVLGERHLGRVLREYCLSYFNRARPHQGIGQLVPFGSANSASGGGEVVAVPVLSGLHHDYRRDSPQKRVFLSCGSVLRAPCGFGQIHDAPIR
jgi:putative transposase